MIIAGVLLAGYFLMSSTRADETNREGRGWELIAEGALLVDVRTPEEFASGHLENAINIPHTETVARLSEYGGDKTKSIVVYCRSGNRSGIAQGLLVEHGFTNVHNAGGYEAILKAKP